VTPGVPSAFMTTTDHAPGSTSQLAAWAPSPAADVIQKSCSAGGTGVSVPGLSVKSTLNGS
jgi:hypothetical protein